MQRKGDLRKSETIKTKRVLITSFKFQKADFNMLTVRLKGLICDGWFRLLVVVTKT